MQHSSVPRKKIGCPFTRNCVPAVVTFAHSERCLQFVRGVPGQLHLQSVQIGMMFVPQLHARAEREGHVDDQLIAFDDEFLRCHLRRFILVQVAVDLEFVVRAGAPVRLRIVTWIRAD